MNIEYSLATSYLLIGTAIGIAVWYALALIIKPDESDKYSGKVMQITIGLAILGIIFAILHLGNMGKFMNLILNPTSWLSREGLFAGLFTGGIILYYLLTRNKADQIKKYNILLYAVLVAGLCALISMGMIYATVTAIPAWNTTLLVLVNIFSGLVLGGVLFLLITKNDLELQSFKTIISSLLIISIVSLVVNIAYEAHISMALNTLAMQGVVIPSLWLSTSIRIIIGLLIPIYLIAKLITVQSEKHSAYISIAFISVLIGEVINKIMHFIIAIKTPFL